MIKVQIVLFDGFDLMDAIAPYEVFSGAAMYSDNALSVEFVTAEGARSVVSGVNGLKIEASGRLDPKRAGIILVPGASGELEGDGPDSIPVLLGRAANTSITELMKQALKQKDVVVATVCGGSLVLAMGGLLEGRSAVTNRLGMDFLGATGVNPVRARVVDDGNLVSGGGVTSGLDVALYLVERELGPRIAIAVEQLFEFERRGTVWRASGLAPLLSSGTQEGDTRETELSSGVRSDAGFDGEWDATLATPVGKLQVRLSITAKDGAIRGTAVQGDEAVEFIDPVLRDGTLTWSLRITKPMRLNLKFEAVVDGDEMTGIAKAGILPATKLTGRRIR
ncbi:DJ-1/PfpI family protein [Cohnella thailandensis]|uniref:DJ-1/PfpI family protein n=1 Tax=Cohnella thailandensis TaxID=557557 RepID=A0A841SZ44_9BACL|nr:DJ-1/PfpI family protein [Cohnella thailandensis]MBB6637473.1 DJ-1/PfpI family protein [Cohnella thailandensis]MBP1977506.1 putative intracellular protease/amidase [Cohnella thailandensis]